MICQHDGFVGREKPETISQDRDCEHTEATEGNMGSDRPLAGVHRVQLKPTAMEETNGWVQGRTGKLA